LSKLTGFSGTVGYVSSAGLPMSQVAAAIALVIEIVGRSLHGARVRGASMRVGHRRMPIHEKLPEQRASSSSISDNWNGPQPQAARAAMG
jgi:hypothetical protein